MKALFKSAGHLPRMPFACPSIETLTASIGDKTSDILWSSAREEAQIVAATNRDLPAMVKARTFREDLFYRLKQVVIHLPPLRERGDDKLLLAHRFLKYVNKQTGETKHFSREAEAFIQSHSWPGNIRELENAVKSAMVFVPHGEVIELEHLKRAIAFDLLPGQISASRQAAGSEMKTISTSVDMPMPDKRAGEDHVRREVGEPPVRQILSR